MRILSLNICHGGGSRIGPIYDYMQRQNADVLVVSEFRNGRTGAQLRDDLLSSGYDHQLAIDCEPRTNSVLLAAKGPISPLSVSPATEDSHRILGGTVSGIDFYGVYFAIGKKKQLGAE